ncbi:MAG: NADH-quinone oxidoreductase subunit H [Candidatus Omnitrophica bacterium]|nr:NADH-quinone oxidoreductase subunit H [Candidatus Omnitrophota bacterium]
MAVEIGIKAILAFIMLMGALNLAGLLTWVERKQSAVMQDRIGANRASIFGIRLLGLFHPLADVLKMLTKEDFVPRGSDRLLYTLAPILSVFFAIPAFAAIPFGDAIQIGERVIELQVANLPIGLLYIFAMMSMGVYGVVLAGISSNNNYSFLGGLRASSQMISYEVTLGVAAMGIVMVYESMNLQEIVRAQGTYLWNVIPKWGVLVQPLGALLFFVAAMAETKRIPFDLPEGESEIIGYFVEYSGMKFGMFFLTDFLETVLLSCMMATLFFGGWQVPYLYPEGFHFPWGSLWSMPHLWVILLGIASFTLKVVFFCWLLMTIRWTLPRFRYDQLMRLGWKIILPLSLINIVVTAIFCLR